MDHHRQRARAVSRRPDFRQKIDRLRALAAGHERDGYRLSTGQLTTMDWPELRAAAWIEGHPPKPRRHVVDYMTGCEQVADQYFGPTVSADYVHQLVQGTGYVVPVPAGSPYFGALASCANAWAQGASWGAGQDANYRQWRRLRAILAKPEPFAVDRDVL